jgi:hypothetical protein
MWVKCGIDEVPLEGDYPPDYEVPGVAATCPRCGRCTESYGTSDASVKRCLALLREGCPRDESNFYVS